MKIAIVGSKIFDDYNIFQNYINKIFKNIDRKDIEIISGGAKGADSLAERFAKENNIKIKIIYPEWNKYGKQAGYLRNIQIIKESDMAIIFWDGKSKGTKHDIDLCEKYKKLYFVYRFDLKGNKL